MENTVKIYQACGEIWQMRAKATEKGATGETAILTNNNLDFFRAAAPLCHCRIIDLGDAGESFGLVNQKLRKILLEFQPIELAKGKKEHDEDDLAKKEVAQLVNSRGPGLEEAKGSYWGMNAIK